MTTATATEQTVDLEALEEDAKRTLGELTEARARLSLDALTDATVAAELENVESEIRSCEQALERAQLAHTEQGRRALEAAEKAAREARERGAAAVDVALIKLAQRVSAWLVTCDEQDRQLQAAGRRPAQRAARDRSLALDAAFIDAMRAVPRGILQLDVGGWAPRGRPLVEGDHRPVQTIEKGCGNDGND